MNTIPEAIKNLKLFYAFKGYNPSIKECITITKEKEISITDSEIEKCTCITSGSDFSKYCLVFNPTEDDAFVLSIDNKLIKNHEGGIADGAIFNIEHFHFLEFKSNAQGHSLEQIKYTYQKAISQLLETLNIFIKKIAQTGVNFLEQSTVYCHIIVSKEFPHASATEQTYRIFFLEKTVELFHIPIELQFEQSFYI